MWLVNTPSRHETLTQCWSNAGPPSTTLAQHQTSTGSTPRANTKHLDSVGLMLRQHRRRWTNIKPTLAQCIVLAGMHTAGGENKPTPTQCLFHVGPASTVLATRSTAIEIYRNWGHLNQILKKKNSNKIITWNFWINPSMPSHYEHHLNCMRVWLASIPLVLVSTWVLHASGIECT